MSQLRQQEQRFEELDVRVKVVTFDADALALSYIRNSGLPWPLLQDTDQSLYREYGMLHGSWWDIYSPGAIMKYMGTMRRGHMPGKPGKDWSQLGGDVLIDPNGIVRMHYISNDPHDRPDVKSILDIIDKQSSDQDQPATQ